MRGFYCITQTEYMIAGNTSLDYTNLFSPNDFQKDDKYITDKHGKRKR